jgi:hypothetical protein
MKIKGQVLIAPNGEIAFRTASGTFAQGAPLISSLAALMRQSGVEFTTSVQPEQHRHDDDPKEHERNHAHTH